MHTENKLKYLKWLVSWKNASMQKSRVQYILSPKSPANHTLDSGHGQVNTWGSEKHPSHLMPTSTVLCNI